MKNSCGITLVELVMTIAIAGFLLGGITLFSSQQVTSTARMRDQLIALYLGQKAMTEINNTAYVSLPVGTTTLAGDPLFTGFQTQRIISAVSGAGAVTLRQIELRVAPAGGSFAQALVSLITYRQSNTTFGNGT